MQVQQQRVKYLGVTISKDLNWKDHIDKSTKKANCIHGFLRRNLKSSKRSTKADAYKYKTFVRPHLEYCCLVWNPYRGEHINQIEMVQRRAARYVTSRYHNTSSVSSMLNDLESRWHKIQLTLTMLYKDHQ